MAIAKSRHQEAGLNFIGAGAALAHRNTSAHGPRRAAGLSVVHKRSKWASLYSSWPWRRAEQHDIVVIDLAWWAMSSFRTLAFTQRAEVWRHGWCMRAGRECWPRCSCWACSIVERQRPLHQVTPRLFAHVTYTARDRAGSSRAGFAAIIAG